MIFGPCSRPVSHTEQSPTSPFVVAGHGIAPSVFGRQILACGADFGEEEFKGRQRLGNAEDSLGVVVDSIKGTIALPPHRRTRLHEILAEVHGRNWVPLRQWQKLLGELRSMILALQGTEGLFSHLQSALLSAGGG